MIDKLQFHYVQQQMLGRPEQSSRFGCSFYERSCKIFRPGSWNYIEVVHLKTSVWDLCFVMLVIISCIVCSCQNTWVSRVKFSVEIINVGHFNCLGKVETIKVMGIRLRLPWDF